MFQLSENWLTEGIMDAEYKQYLLLAYLRDVHNVFKNRILYPPFAELIEHHRHLKKIKHNLTQIKEARKEVKGIDWQNMKLIYGTKEDENIKEYDEVKNIIEEVIDFSIPKIENEIEYAKNIFDEIERKLKYSTVGIIPIRKDKGYFLIQNYPTSDFYAYRYELSDLYIQTESGNVPFKRLETQYVSTYTLSLNKSLTSIKQEIIKQSPDLPNPAVYSFFPNDTASMEYTILPIVKRVVMKLIA